jgi:hypothetical protein
MHGRIASDFLAVLVLERFGESGEPEKGVVGRELSCLSRT